MSEHEAVKRIEKFVEEKESEGINLCPKKQWK